MSLSIESFFVILLVSGVLITSGLFLRTLQKLQQKQFGAGIRNAIYTLLFLFVASTGGLLVTNVITYNRLSYEMPVARLQIKQLKKQRFQVSVVYLKDCQSRQYLLNGDEWQLDARIIKWHSWANLLGLNALYQLDRIQGRYRSIEQQRQTLPTVFQLESQPGVDLWALKKQYQWLPLLDAEYGQSVFMTMQPEQWYEIYLSQSGLIARKINPPAINGNCSVTGMAKHL